MALSYKKYKKKYLKSCMELIRTTWLFEENFENPRQPMYIYKYYVENCVNWSEHLELLVDEQDKVLGILFGSIEDNSCFRELLFRLTQWKIDLAMRLHILIGDLGKRKQAMAAYQTMCQHDADGEAVANDYDSEVNLFILDPSLRGRGYGRKLMDRYIKFCHKNDLDSVFLWTTTDCSFWFYEQYGFKERERFAFGGASDDEAPHEEGIVFYYIGKFSELAYIIQSPPGRMHTMCRGRLLCSRTLARKESKSLMSEGFRGLKWTCPLCCKNI